ncbi:MAG: hypothetical protein QXJ14_03285 [Candidatus Aenigmatarchaeota archaeon]
MKIKIIDFKKKGSGGFKLPIPIELKALYIETDKQITFEFNSFEFNFTLPNTIDIGKVKMELVGQNEYKEYKITFNKTKPLTLNTDAVVLGLAILKTKSLSIEVNDEIIAYPISLILIGVIIGKYVFNK